MIPTGRFTSRCCGRRWSNACGRPARAARSWTSRSAKPVTPSPCSIAIPDIALLGSDADEALLARSRGRLAGYAGRFELRQAWSDEALGDLAPAAVDLILMDLGMCLFHIEGGARGFSFLRDEPPGHAFRSTPGASRPPIS